MIDDFGGELFKPDTQTFNIAFLRTVEGRGSIQISDEIPFATVSDGLRRILNFIKKYHEEFLKDYKVRGTLTSEV